MELHALGVAECGVWGPDALQGVGAVQGEVGDACDVEREARVCPLLDQEQVHGEILSRYAYSYLQLHTRRNVVLYVLAYHGIFRKF